MRTSYHLSRVPISHSDQYLLFQTLRGAVDVVSVDLAGALNNFHDSGGESLTPDETESLRRRGYLTEQTPEEEKEHARGILRLLSKNLPSVVELDFIFPDGASELTTDEDWLEQSFSLAGKLAGEAGAVVVGLEVGAPRVDANAFEAVLRRASARGHVILPRVTLASLCALTPWLKSENFRQALISTDSDSAPVGDVEDAAEQIVNLFNRQIHPLWKCRVDGMTEAQLGAAAAVAERVRQKYPFFRLHLSSASLEPTAEPLTFRVNGHSLPGISAGNEALLSTMTRFILMAGKINYRPFFQPESAKLTATLEDKRLTFQEGVGAATLEGFAAISAHAEQSARDGDGGDLWDTIAPTSPRLDCMYALVCGCAQGRAARAEGAALECGAPFERRLRQVLPLLLFNLQGNWRPSEARV
jgi:hypothetical protein